MDPPAIGIATVNAAIVAVFFGAVVAYAVVVAHRIHDMTDAVMETVREINNFSEAVRYIDAQDSDFLQRWDMENFEDRYDLIQCIGTIGTMRYHPDNMEVGPRTDANTLSVTDAKRMTMSIMAFLTGRYPFPGRFRFGSSESVLPYMLIPERVEIRTLEEAERWIGMMKELKMWVDSLVADKVGALGDLFEEESRPRREAFAQTPFSYRGKGAQADRERFQAEFDHTDVPQRFMNSFRVGDEIANRASNQFLELQNYKHARLSRPRLRWVIAACVVATAVFLAGVVMPLVDTHAQRWAVIWLPVIVYLACIPIGFWHLGRLYRRAPKKPTG